MKKCGLRKYQKLLPSELPLHALSGVRITSFPLAA
jgi:hypothetical protein